MPGLLIKSFGVAAAIVLIVYMAASAFRRARRLDARIREFQEEQDEITRKRGPINPYASLAELYTEQEQEARQKRRSKRK